MLLEYGFRNYFCFKEGAKVSFKLDANCPKTISRGRNFTPVLCVKGANGAGKTNLLKGLSFLASFCARSFEAGPDADIDAAPFYDSKKPSEFYVEFSVGKISYLYELSVTEKEVVHEFLYQTKLKKTKILERKGTALTYTTKKLKRLETIQLRRNASVISTARQYGLDELEDVAEFFQRIIANVDFFGLRQQEGSLNGASSFYKKYEDAFVFAKNFIKSCDLGISDIRLLEMRKSNIPTATNSKDTEKQYFPVFVHLVNKKEHSITRFTESSGTKALYEVLGLYETMLAAGGVLVLDEFDVNLHPHILPRLVDLFLDPKKNKHDAQLIFSTHNSEVLDLLGRYRTYLVNKENNEAYAYRLDEIPGDILRNDRSIIPAYNDGKIGGIPRI